MGLIERFLGRRGEKNRPVANPAVERPLGLNVFFPKKPEWDADELQLTLRQYHPSMAAATFEIDLELAARGTPIGLAAWENHVVRIIGFDVPMPERVVEACVEAAHYGPELKARARAHKAHALLSYGGSNESALEQYVALATVAGTLADVGAEVVANENALTSFPAKALTRAPEVSDMLAVLRTMPLLYLYCGFAKYVLKDVPGVWMRTHGNHLLGLPDLATHAQGHGSATRVHGIFSNIMGYLLSSKVRLDAGHTAQVDENEFIKLRVPGPDEHFLQSPTELLVVEFITADQVNGRSGSA